MAEGPQRRRAPALTPQLSQTRYETIVSTSPPDADESPLRSGATTSTSSPSLETPSSPGAPAIIHLVSPSKPSPLSASSPGSSSSIMAQIGPSDTAAAPTPATLTTAPPPTPTASSPSTPSKPHPQPSSPSTPTNSASAPASGGGPGHIPPSKARGRGRGRANGAAGSGPSRGGGGGSNPGSLRAAPSPKDPALQPGSVSRSVSETTVVRPARAPPNAGGSAPPSQPPPSIPQTPPPSLAATPPPSSQEVSTTPAGEQRARSRPPPSRGGAAAGASSPSASSPSTPTPAPTTAFRGSDRGRGRGGAPMAPPRSNLTQSNSGSSSELLSAQQPPAERSGSFSGSSVPPPPSSLVPPPPMDLAPPPPGPPMRPARFVAATQPKTESITPANLKKQRATLSQRGIQSLRARGSRGDVRMGAGREVSTKGPLAPTGGSPSPPPAGSAPPPAAPSSSSSSSQPVPIDRREAIIAEILTTEQTYVQSLQSVINDYLEPLRDQEAKIGEGVIQQVFSNIEVIFRFNLELLLQLEPRLQNKQGGSSGNIGDIFLMLGPFLKMYTAYGNNYEAAAEKHHRLMAENKAYAAVVESQFAAQMAQNENSLELQALLIMPIQRIPRYRLLLQELLKYTPETHPDYANINKAVAEVMKVAEHVNEGIRHTENSRLLLDISPVARALLEDLLLAHRRIIRKAMVPVVLVAHNEKHDSKHRYKPVEMQVYLFNDIMILAKETKDVNTSERFYWQLCITWFDDKCNRLSELREKEKWAKHMIELLSPEYSCVLCCQNAEVKEAWAGDFTKRINEAIPAGNDDLDVRQGEHHYQGSKGHYIGQWRRGKRDGRGIFTLGRERYDGEWHRDMRWGFGEQLFLNGVIYRGTWEADSPHGEGVQIFSDTVRYEGGFKQGKRHGKGVMSLPMAEEFVGDWNEGQMFKGTLKRSFKDLVISYTGSFANGKKEGKGMLFHGEQLVYEGLWRENKFHGTGTNTLPDGSVFKGTFAQGKRDGMGRMVYANGDVYEGQWSGDEMHGSGVFTWKDGRMRYDGEWNQGRRQGKGTMTLPNGDVYEGEWDNDRYHGVGILTYASGLKLEGKWVQGQSDTGKCMCTLPASEKAVPAVFDGDTLIVGDMRLFPGPAMPL